MKFIVAFLFFVFINQSFAQMPDVKQPVLDAMSKVSDMIGTWEGSGWQMNQKGEKQSTNVHEEITWMLDSTIVLIKGLGTNDGIITHNAFAVLAYEPFQKMYKMNSYLSNGLSTTAEFSVIEENKAFSWKMTDKRGGTTRYTITISQSNQWKEVGEYSSDSENWHQFFEMNLKRIN